MAEQGNRDAERMAQSVKMSDRRNFRNMVGSARYYLTFAAALAVLLTTWYFAAKIVNHPFQFPYLESVLKELARAMSDLYVWRNVIITFRRVFTGVFYAILIGFPLGILMGYSQFMMRLLAPFINALRQIPITSWIPLAIIWFGLGDGPSIFVITFTAVFTIVLNTVAGVNEIAPEYYHAVRTMGANTLGVIKDVVLPGCMSGLITGVRIALGIAWMTVVWAEFIATTTGFGFLIQQAQQDMVTERCIAYMFLAGILGFGQDRVILVAESLLLRWKG